MNVISSWVIYQPMHIKPAKALSCHITDIEGGVLLSCADTLAFGLVLACEKLEKNLPSSPKIVISHNDRSDVFAIHSSSTEQLVNNNNKPQPSADSEK